MSWNPSNRTLESFHLGVCPICKGPIRVGQRDQESRYRHRMEALQL